MTHLLADRVDAKPSVDEIEKMISACRIAAGIMGNQGFSEAHIARAFVSFGRILMQEAVGLTEADTIVQDYDL